MRRSPFRRARAGLAIAVAMLSVSLALPAGVIGARPTNGSKAFSARDQSLPWRFFTTGYPSWVVAASQAALDTNFDDPATNNSRSALFSYTAGGPGRLHYHAAYTSPCDTGNLQWLQCAPYAGITAWHIYIRDFDLAPYTNPFGQDFKWYDSTSSCNTGTNVCWWARRALIHEAGHVIGFVHDGQGEQYTVMASTTPWYNDTGWMGNLFRKCDEAAMQLFWDVRVVSGPYAQCFESLANAGPTGGLQTFVTTTGTSFGVCIGQGVTVSGKLHVSVFTDYKELSDNPLQGRLVRFDRRPHGSGSWTANVYSTTATATYPADNWTKAFSGLTGSWDFRAHFDGETASLEPSNQPTFTITWSNPC